MKFHVLQRKDAVSRMSTHYDRRMRNYYVYILASHSRCLYTGITNDLFVRVYQQKTGAIAGFTRTYRTNRLVHFESTANVHAAIAREKQLKRWPRLRKYRLIERTTRGGETSASTGTSIP
ncbi:MAG: GIY-YIG nuclease family protein [bacterium]